MLFSELNTAWRTLSVVGRVDRPSGAISLRPPNSPEITRIAARLRVMFDSPPPADLTPEAEIVCVDCGGRCFLLTQPNEDGVWYPGDIVSYRCQDCRDR